MSQKLSVLIRTLFPGLLLNSNLCRCVASITTWLDHNLEKIPSEKQTRERKREKKKASFSFCLRQVIISPCCLHVTGISDIQRLLLTPWERTLQYSWFVCVPPDRERNEEKVVTTSHMSCTWFHLVLKLPTSCWLFSINPLIKKITAEFEKCTL